MDIPVIAFSVGEEELSGIDTGPLVGHLAAWNCFMSVDSDGYGELTDAWRFVLGALLVFVTLRLRRGLQGRVQRRRDTRAPSEHGVGSDASSGAREKAEGPMDHVAADREILEVYLGSWRYSSRATCISGRGGVS